MDKFRHSCSIIRAERGWVWSTYGRVRDARKLEWRSRVSITQQNVLAMTVSVRYKVHDSAFLPSSPCFFPFIPSIPFYASHCLSCLWLSLFHAKAAMSRRNRFADLLWSCCYDSFICLSHILLSLQSPHKMLWIRPEDGMVGEEGGREGSVGWTMLTWIPEEDTWWSSVWPAMERWRVGQQESKFFYIL